MAEAAIQTTGTLPEGFIPGCLTIIDSTTMEPGQKLWCLRNQFAGLAAWDAQTTGIADATIGNGIADHRLAKGLTKEEILGYVPEGQTGVTARADPRERCSRNIPIQRWPACSALRSVTRAAIW
jgi:hypothetical protein